MVTALRLVQPKNAKLSMYCTLFGIVTLVRLVQLANVLPRILVTLLGMVMLVRPELWNAFFSIVSTLAGIVILVSLEQLRNAFSSIEVTLFGMVTLVNRVQSLNASFAIDVTGKLFTALGIAKEPTVDVSTSETVISLLIGVPKVKGLISTVGLPANVLLQPLLYE
jgi:hypothetical protein